MPMRSKHRGLQPFDLKTRCDFSSQGHRKTHAKAAFKMGEHRDKEQNPFGQLPFNLLGISAHRSHLRPQEMHQLTQT